LAREVIQDRFWDLIEGNFPDRALLRAALDGLDRNDLVAFAGHVIVARNLVCPRDRGPPVGPQQIRLSPVSTEDLTEWVVGRGREFWKLHRRADEAKLRALHTEFQDQSTPQLVGEAFHSFGDRFEGDMNAAVDAYLDSKSKKKR